MSTRSDDQKRAPDAPSQQLALRRGEPLDPVEQVAQVAMARRKTLLRRYQHKLGLQELEECLSQVTLELIEGANKGASFESTSHLANHLEQRLKWRTHDRDRVLNTKSERYQDIERALRHGNLEVAGVNAVDVRSDTEQIVMLRERFDQAQELVDRLSPDQRLALNYQVLGQIGRAEFCERFDWSTEKYNSVLKRARKKLRELDADAQIEGSRLPAARLGHEVAKKIVESSAPFLAQRSD